MRDGEFFVDFEEDFRPNKPEDIQWRNERIKAHNEAMLKAMTDKAEQGEVEMKDSASDEPAVS